MEQAGEKQMKWEKFGEEEYSYGDEAFLFRLLEHDDTPWALDILDAERYYWYETDVSAQKAYAEYLATGVIKDDLDD